jgi:hypothetical protein
LPGAQLSVNDAEMGSRSDTFARLRTVQAGTALIERPTFAVQPKAAIPCARWHCRDVPTSDIRYACFRFGADPALERRNSGIAVSSG